MRQGHSWLMSNPIRPGQVRSGQVRWRISSGSHSIFVLKFSRSTSLCSHYYIEHEEMTSHLVLCNADGSLGDVVAAQQGVLGQDPPHTHWHRVQAQALPASDGGPCIVLQADAKCHAQCLVCFSPGIFLKKLAKHIPGKNKLFRTRPSFVNIS